MLSVFIFCPFRPENNNLSADCRGYTVVYPRQRVSDLIRTLSYKLSCQQGIHGKFSMVNVKIIAWSLIGKQLHDRLSKTIAWSSIAWSPTENNNIVVNVKKCHGRQ